MNWLDYAVIGIVALSALLGVWRGLVYEVLSLLGWVAAYWVARLFAQELAPYVPEFVGAESLRLAAAFAGLFIATLIVSGLLAWGVSRLMQVAGLGFLDKLLGALFGLMRGVLIVLALVWLAGLTDMPKQAYWRDARLTATLQSLAMSVKDWLPGNLAQRLHY
jgi:membrane protein required for colicin V production